MGEWVRGRAGGREEGEAGSERRVGRTGIKLYLHDGSIDHACDLLPPLDGATWKLGGGLCQQA